MYERELLKLSDGGQITLQVINHSEQAGIVCIVPGLTGHGDELYVKNTAQAALDEGYNVIVINHRGGSKTPITSSKMYCAGSSWDLKEAIHGIKKLYPNQKLYGVGFSLGANIMGKYMAEEGLNAELESASCVCGPMDLQLSSQHLEGHMGGFFS